MRKRYKLLLIIFISFLLVFFIYFCFRKDEFIYINLGDNLSFNNLSTYNYSEYLKYYYPNLISYNFQEDYSPVIELLRKVNDNEDNINYYLKRANIITFSLGIYEMYNYKELNEENIINYLNNLYILLDKISKINNNVFVINVYPEEYSLINKKIKDYCEKFNLIYIDVYSIHKNNIFQKDLKAYLNYKGHKAIADIIVKKMNNKK